MIFLRFPGGRRKALTFSYDDGVEQDARLIRILNDHGMKGTFNVNSGLFVPEGTKFEPGFAHRRMTLAAARDLYRGSGHEVAVHGVTHASLPELSPEQMVLEITRDRMTLESAFGCIIRGMAYPFGTFDDQTVAVLRACGMQYARTVISGHAFSIPRDWLRLPATCHHNDPELMPLADQFLAAYKPYESKLFYLWGHAYEFEEKNNWDVIERFADKMAGHDSVWYATNIEICDYVQGWKQVYTSADGLMMHNPTAHSFWFDRDYEPYCIHPGETLTFNSPSQP